MSKCLYCYKELGEREIDFHSNCAKKIFNTSDVPFLDYTRDDIVDLAKQIIETKTTLTGVQSKLSLNIDSKTEPKRFTIVDYKGMYILKPQTDLFRCLPEVEDLSMHLAEIAKISVVPHSLIRFKDGELCYITKRIDRDKFGNKLAMEDMCQLSERLTEDKYKGSYEQIVKLLNKYSSFPNMNISNFWEQVVFSWIIGNSDMHLKNFSIYSKNRGEYILTPAYDLLSVNLVYKKDLEELALNLCGKKSKIRKEHFVSTMLKSGIKEKAIENLFKKFIKIQSKWNEFIDISFLPNDMKEEYKLIIDYKLRMLK